MSGWREETIGDCRLICADCRDVFRSFLAADAVVTDPPYPDIDKGFPITGIDWLYRVPGRQLVFWSAVCDFPLSFSAIHIWHKPNGCSSQHYERIFERNGAKTCRVFRRAAILPDYVQYRHECVDHPTQKPLSLMLDLIEMGTDHAALVFDPFMGSGSTGVACAKLGRRFVGIEIEPRWFDLACRRIEAAHRQADLFVERPPKPEQAVLALGDAA